LVKFWATPEAGLTEAPVEVAIVGTRAVTFAPKGTVTAMVWLVSLITPSPSEKLKAVMAFAELKATVSVYVFVV